jgi:hypothetical protein
VNSQSSALVVELRLDSNIGFVHISLVDTGSFEDVVIEIKSRLTTQVK